MWEDSPRAPQHFFDAGVPVLGICYGQQTMMQQLGGNVEGGESGEFGRAFIEVKKGCALFAGLWAEGEKPQVWMCHGEQGKGLSTGFEWGAGGDGKGSGIGKG